MAVFPYTDLGYTYRNFTHSNDRDKRSDSESGSALRLGVDFLLTEKQLNSATINDMACDEYAIGGFSFGEGKFSITPPTYGQGERSPPATCWNSETMLASYQTNQNRDKPSFGKPDIVNRFRMKRLLLVHSRTSRQ